MTSASTAQEGPIVSRSETLEDLIPPSTINSLRKEAQEIRDGALKRELEFINRGVKEAQAIASGTSYVRDLVLSEPVWRCNQLQDLINDNAGAAHRATDMLIGLIFRMTKNGIEPSFTPQETERLRQIREGIEALAQDKQ